MSNYKEVTIESLAHGAIVNHFNRELKHVLQNIADENTAATTVREITIKVKIKPDPVREVAGVNVQCSSKLAPIQPATSTIHFTADGKTYKAHENYKHKQGELDFGNVSDIKKGAK